MAVDGAEGARRGKETYIKMTGSEVKAWREARDMSQGQLAKMLPMNLRTLQGWERAQPNGTPPPFMRRALDDLEREMTFGTRGARRDGPVICDDIETHLDAGRLAGLGGARATAEREAELARDRQPKGYALGESNPWTDERAGEGFPPPGAAEERRARMLRDEPAEQFLGRPLADFEPGGSIQLKYEELINAPDADCPGCGAQPMQMHGEGCRGAPDEPAHELSYESDDKPVTIEGDFEARNVRRKR